MIYQVGMLMRLNVLKNDVMASIDDNIYYKKGNKYIPFGLRYNNYLSDGIWYVRHYEHSCGITNVDRYISGLYKVGNHETIDIPKLCGLHSYTEYVLCSPEFKEILDKGSYTYQELVAKIVALVLKLNETLKEKEKSKNGTR